jgi:hypothetical protein
MNAPTKFSLAQEMATAHRVADALTAAGVTADDPDFSELMASETDIQRHLARLLRVARREEAEAVGCTKIEAELRARIDRKQLRAEKLRAIVRDAMQELGLTKLPAPDFTASLSAGRSKVVLLDEDAVPDQFFATKRTLDKRALAAALESGPVEGATLSNPEPTLTIRGK